MLYYINTSKNITLPAVNVIHSPVWTVWKIQKPISYSARRSRKIFMSKNQKNNFMNVSFKKFFAPGREIPGNYICNNLFPYEISDFVSRFSVNKLS